MMDISSSVWAIRPSVNLRELFAFRDKAFRAPRADWTERFRPAVAADLLKINADTADIFISGPIFPDAWLIEGTCTRALRVAVAQAIADPAVSSITLYLDSPGGSVAGIPPIVAALRDSPKPVRAYILSECCSAAYWLASQAKAGIFAERGAFIGCLGVYQVLVDSSKLNEDIGVKVRVYASDPIKGLGVSGAPISEEQDAFMRDHIAEIAAAFWSDIHAVRKAVPREAFTGAWCLPPKALDLHLIDDFQL